MSGLGINTDRFTFLYRFQKINKHLKKYKNGGKPIEIATSRFAFENQRSVEEKIEKTKATHQNASVLVLVPVFANDFSLILLLAEFTRSIVEDLSDGRSPLILINRFRNYCNNNPRTIWDEGIQIFPQEGRKLNIYIGMNSGIVSSLFWYNYVHISYSIRFLRLLTETLCLPTYCLVDCDPYGFDILSTYRFGSMQMAYDAKFLRVPEICWLGAFPSDIEKYDLPQQCLLPLTAEDMKRTEAMLLRCYLQREVPQWRSELELMLQRGVKFELEALSVRSLSFLTEVYIPSKIQGAYSVAIDAEKGTVRISGRVNPNLALRILQNNGKHAEVISIKFDGEVVEPNFNYYSFYGENINGFVNNPHRVAYPPYPFLMGPPQYPFYERAPHYFLPPPPPLLPQPLLPPPPYLPPCPPPPQPPPPPPPPVNNSPSVPKEMVVSPPSRKEPKGAYSVAIDAEKGTVRISGRVNRNLSLRILQNNGKHAEVISIKFDGEVGEPNFNYYSFYGENINGFINNPHRVAYPPYPFLMGPPQYPFYERAPHYFLPPPPPLLLTTTTTTTISTTMSATTTTTAPVTR
ncbi:hypothetical protein LWI29_022900 [Acer saccharum]|uniref:Topoisomerase 6 subunit A/Spo11 TOPRIM domain-containing protein n=1 Tax=Acer saccharum TaxID=4024 RepID=A0AA39SYG3_ACESA|nr:hypothetical protein LWI29_022900 [Acer saccharum]